MDSEYVIGGIEGGGTKTIVVLMTNKGEILCEVCGASSNPVIMGYENCSHLINELISEAKDKAGLSKDYRLRSLGLCLSGLELESLQHKLESTLRQLYPNLSEEYFIGSDTRAPLALVSSKGGVVLISGTGSNCLLMNSDGESFQCGGLGFRLGDEGSAYWIAFQGIKTCIDSVSRFQKAPNNYPITQLWEVVQEHFKIQTVNDLIPVFYSNFRKDHIASLCIKIKSLAEDGDDLCKWLFDEAGRHLAKHVQAVYNSADVVLKSCEGGLKIVCVGSVWKSWNLLKTGFVAQLKDTSEANIDKLSLVFPNKSNAIGSCYLAAQEANLNNFSFCYKNNYNVFYKYSK